MVLTLRIITTVFLALILIAYLGILFSNKYSHKTTEKIGYLILMAIDISAIVFIWV